MLNTDAHNPNLDKRQRMTKEQFVRNNRGRGLLGVASSLPSGYWLVHRD
jgi:hypothetical protein